MATQDRFKDGFKCNEFLRDVTTGEFVLLTNGICCLDEVHKNHAEGCVYVPYEGLVFKGTPDNPETWGMKLLTGREFVKADSADAVKLRTWFEKRLDEIANSKG